MFGFDNNQHVTDEQQMRLETLGGHKRVNRGVLTVSQQKGNMAAEISASVSNF